MAAYIRNWLSSQWTPADPTSAAPQVPEIISSPPEDEDDTETVRGDDSGGEDSPPAFPSINSAQRLGSSKSATNSSPIPSILSDSERMPPPPPPSLATRRPGVVSSNSLAIPQTGSLLALPPTTTKAPSKKASRKVALQPGHGPLDWANLKKSGTDLRGVDGLMRVSPSVLKQHNKRDDAWSAFNGKVYNITSYLPYHPGGEKELMRVAGRDGTKLFCMHGEGNSSDLSLLSRIQLEDNTTDSHKQGAYRQPLFRNKMQPLSYGDKGRRRSLIDRIAQNGDEGEEEGGSAEGQRLLKESVPETAVSREELELQREHESHENPVSPVEEPASPTSEAAVDNLLENEADIEDGSTAAMNTNERPSNTIAATLPSSDSPQSSLKPASPVDLALMEEAKRLLIPVIARNAQLRDPDADMEAIKERVMSLVTDAQCLEFVRLAREARDQMQDKSERVAADLAKSGREERGKNVQEHSVQQDLEGRSQEKKRPSTNTLNH
ncbi:hypothetical protein EW026_g5539 [Hermanssonia centrifuga]|uniref:Cytochrome b5 heme-binding domain-containing protein n=1 Tax=Hermanssonia centrifuga TaxID=98765 RepID=A0A4V3XA12_9APHY|nr:hypothetical protein EW026_g5539 [Hermanssonia centrifuga]